MSRRRPDHPRITDDAVADARATARRGRARRRRLRLVRGAIKTVFWGLVLAGVFILGIGYGANVGGADSQEAGDVTITQEPIEVQATLPTVTETVTETVTKTVTRPRTGRASSKRSE